MRSLTSELLAQIFTEAADLIEHTVQGTYYTVEDSGRRCYCAMGAVYKAANQVLDADGNVLDGDGPDAIDAALELDERLKIISFNDEQANAKEEVVSFLHCKAEEYSNR